MKSGPKAQMTRAEKALFVLPLIALALFFMARWVTETYARVPFQMMQISSENKSGMATITTDAFSVGFQGHSFSAAKVDAQMTVDGRYGPSSRPWAHESMYSHHRTGVQIKYSQWERLLTIRYSGHQVDYSHHLRVLRVNGADYSTTDGPVHLAIQKSGKIIRR
jgi:hypothetical protein